MLRPLRACAVFLLFPFVLHAQTLWTLGRTNLPGVIRSQSIAFGNGRFVATLLSVPNTGPAAAWSFDGQNWTAAKPGLPQLGTVAFIAGAFYLVGDGGVWRSTDGDDWLRVYTAIAPVTTLRGIASDGRGMLTIWPNTAATRLLISANLQEWHETAPLPEAGQPNTQLSIDTVTYFGGRYYVTYFVRLPGISRNAVATTVDGTVWTPHTTLAPVQFIAAGNGRLVAFGVEPTGGYALATTDGINFTRSPLNALLSNGGRMGFAGGRFFLLGSFTASLDGVTWAALGTKPTLNGPGDIQAIAYGNGRYVAVGADSLPGPTFTSIDVVATLAIAAPPVIASSPASRTVAEGASLFLEVALDNPSTDTTFQWRRNGVAITGATAARYTIASATAGDAGRYSVDVRNPIGAVSSDAADLTVVPAAQAGRIVNLSVLTSIDRAGESLSVGFVVGGTGTSGPKSILARAGGPSLVTFGVANPNSDPKLELWSGGRKVGENDNWSGAADTTAAIVQVGAFAFVTSTSRDAALLAAVATGDNSVILSANAGATGPVIAEVYDATPIASVTAATPRLINVSVLKSIPVAGTLAAGFVVAGATDTTVLVRAVGPGLRAFVGDGAHPDPTLALYRSGIAVPIAANDNWRGTVELANAFASVGAFALPTASNDAALLITLPPGNYTAQVSGTGTTSGQVLVEVYEVR